jgi:hypothetical protein
VRIVEKQGGKIILYDDENRIAYIGENKNVARYMAKQMVNSGKTVIRLNDKFKKGVIVEEVTEK